MIAGAPLGIIETLTEGFTTLNKRLWLLLVPLLLDLFLVFGPGISITPLLETSEAWLQESAAGVSAEGGDSLVERLRDTNFFGILAWQLPSLVAATSAST